MGKAKPEALKAAAVTAQRILSQVTEGNRAPFPISYSQDPLPQL